MRLSIRVKQIAGVTALVENTNAKGQCYKARNFCSPEGLDAAETARSRARVSNIAFGVALLGLIVFLLLKALLPDDVVNNSAGFASLEAAATLTSVGVSYLFHRTGHHKLERWLSIGHIAVTAFGDVRNYSLESRHH